MKRKIAGGRETVIWPRLGLCCLFLEEPIKFRHLYAVSLRSLDKSSASLKISEVCLHNASSLLDSLKALSRLGIRGFRIMSQMLPLYTHPEWGYDLETLPDSESIVSLLRKAGSFAENNGIRLSFHPDQFTVLASHSETVVNNSISELLYHTTLAEILGADVINIHVGGVYGDKARALDNFSRNLNRLPENCRKLIALENDDRQYSPSDILPLCRTEGIPMTYDIHHHRCNRDGMEIEEAAEAAQKTWSVLGREPYFHISSPKDGWDSRNPRAHADYIAPEDFPDFLVGLRVSLDVEAKAKELAVIKLGKLIGSKLVKIR